MAQTKKNERQDGPSYKVSSYKGRGQAAQSRDSVEVVSMRSGKSAQERDVPEASTLVPVYILKLPRSDRFSAC